MKNIVILIAFMFVGCASPLDVRSMSTAQLEERRAEIDRKLNTDDLGVAWGASRWISHATEKKKVLNEKQAINNELSRRQQTTRKSVGSTSGRAPQ
jgi:hypothetical protein